MNATATRILIISSEVESLARTGGLGDVVSALSRALAALGADVLVVTPRYGVTQVPPKTHTWLSGVPARWGWGPGDVREVGVIELEGTTTAAGGRHRVCLVEDPGLYDRQGIYGDEHGDFGDNPLRFAVMSRAALEIAARIWDGGPHLVHAHDWHAAFAVLYAKSVMGETWAKVPAVVTVHNAAFQGLLPESALDNLHLPRSLYVPEVLEHNGGVNLLKGAIALADRITTVSPTYAAEIQTPEVGAGLDVHFRAHVDRLSGITNGIDVVSYDPAHDGAIAMHYDAGYFAAGRAACKIALAQDLGLDAIDGPIFGCVARLTWQKGVDMLLPMLGEIVERAGRVIVIGTGDEDLQRHLVAASERYRGRVAVRIAFDAVLARRVWAGADFVYVPSRFEPCGLTQMYAMRYGAIPIVTDVGGLHDTVTPIDGEGNGTGFLAKHPDFASVRARTIQAFELHADPEAMQAAITRAMSRDSSWAAPAKEYLAVYAAAQARRA